MTQRFDPINLKCPHMLHGGDYNPDQWSEDVWAEDMRLMKLAGCNAMSVGIFSWVRLEPQEGRYSFGWLDRVVDLLADNGAYAVLGTPSAAQPAWMSAAYPEVLRVGPDRTRNPHGHRVNYCLSSPVYRRKVAEINERLAERYADHPALLVWHISNEYSGACYCEVCLEAWRDWLRRRYGGLDAVNGAWWTAFMGHTFTDWDQIGLPDSSISGMVLDWKRFVTDLTADFLRNEVEAVRRHSRDTPVTTNMMGLHSGLNYWQMLDELDVVSWDAYPQYHDRDGDWKIAAGFSFTHDIHRAMKGGRPWMLMESSPSATNWMPVGKLNRPGIHLLKSVQAVAHGADTVQYFQWRKSRGGVEKFHGAVVDHVCHEDTRVFRDVAEVGRVLGRLDDVVGTTTRPEVAILYDWENRWAIEGARGPRREGKDYTETCQRHYRQLWSMGIDADVVPMDHDLSAYRLVAAPMLYMIRPGVAERIAEFVEAGGLFVATYFSGIADESDRCFLGGFPGPLRTLTGVWAEEIDCLYDDESVEVAMVDGNELDLTGRYRAGGMCDLIHAEEATVLATYASEFYESRSALTVREAGRGRCYYLASRNEDRFLADFYAALAQRADLASPLPRPLPEGVTVRRRTDGERSFLFLLNFTPKIVEVDLPKDGCTDLLWSRKVTGTVQVPGYGVRILATDHEVGD